ncbi:MAG: DJ-1/PfpI family protein [Lentisphaeria bacterium]|nr:DJ-1/PfpI family protein [Lentisphaeria bacterium]
MKPPTIAVLLANGFEEIEAVTIIDVLRRADLRVSVASINEEERVTGAHGLTLVTDTVLSKLRPLDFDMVVLPGGMPGSENLASGAEVLGFLRALHARGAFVCAICAAPIALAAAGLLADKRVTCYPGFESRLTDAHYTAERVQTDGRIITGNGPGAALEFSYELVRQLGLTDVAEQLSTGMLASQ